jgi:transcriptional regulator with XRE-family HTH domain
MNEGHVREVDLDRLWQQHLRVRRPRLRLQGKRAICAVCFVAIRAPAMVCSDSCADQFVDLYPSLLELPDLTEAEFLRETRTRLRLTRDDVAELAGVSLSTVRRAECAHGVLPEMVKRIRVALEAAAHEAAKAGRALPVEALEVPRFRRKGFDQRWACWGENRVAKGRQRAAHAD